jgi:23S rRNA pseudouridine1911/1915/1917 synthase
LKGKGQTDHAENGELYEHHRFVADKGQSLIRIDKFLYDKLEKISRTKIQSAAQANCILVNNHPVKSNYKVKPGDSISIVLPHPPHEFKLIPEDIPVNITYEDDDLLVINKPPGMVVHPGHGNYSGTLVNALAWYLKDSPLFSNEEIRPGLVHRIDKNTSGLLVVAKNEIALSHLARQFYNKTTERKYQALVWGSFDKKEGTIEGNIGRDPKDRVKMCVFSDGEDGKHAVTHYRVLEPFGYISLIECRLETGRTHQIRVHMSSVGHPVFNDEWYGGDKIIKGTTFSKYRQFIRNCFETIPRQALHAKLLKFVHPRSGKELSFDSELPEDMQQVIEKWRTYTSGRPNE